MQKVAQHGIWSGVVSDEPVCVSWFAFWKVKWNGFTYVKGFHLCLLPWNWEAMKEVGLLHISPGRTMNFWTWPDRKYSEDSTWTPATCYSKRFCLVRALLTNYTQPRLVFCPHTNQNSLQTTYKSTPFDFKNTLTFVPWEGTIWVATSVSPELQFWEHK